MNTDTALPPRQTPGDAILVGEMMSKVAQQHQNILRPGAALKGFRKERGWTLAEVSERSGIPVSTLSKIENGKSEVTMDRLLCISVALDMNIADFLGAPEKKRTSGAGGRRSLTHDGEERYVDSPYGKYCYHAQDLLEKQMVPMIAEIKARDLADFGAYHRHEGEEYIYVLEGELALHTDTYAPINLKKGESIYFDSMIGHAYLAAGDTPCKILITCSNAGAKNLEEFIRFDPEPDGVE